LILKTGKQTPYYSLYEQQAERGKEATEALGDFSEFLKRYVDPVKSQLLDDESLKAQNHINELSDTRDPDTVFGSLMNFQKSRTAMTDCLKADMKTNQKFLSQFEPKLAATQEPVEALSNISFWILAASHGNFGETKVDDPGKDTTDVFEFWQNAAEAESQCLERSVRHKLTVLDNTEAQEEALTIYNSLIGKEKWRNKDSRSSRRARSSR
jgi:hypothetical protein